MAVDGEIGEKDEVDLICEIYFPLSPSVIFMAQLSTFKVSILYEAIFQVKKRRGHTYYGKQFFSLNSTDASSCNVIQCLSLLILLKFMAWNEECLSFSLEKHYLILIDDGRKVLLFCVVLCDFISVLLYSKGYNHNNFLMLKKKIEKRHPPKCFLGIILSWKTIKLRLTLSNRRRQDGG